MSQASCGKEVQGNSWCWSTVCSAHTHPQHVMSHLAPVTCATPRTFPFAVGQINSRLVSPEPLLLLSQKKGGLNGISTPLIHSSRPSTRSLGPAAKPLDFTGVLPAQGFMGFTVSCHLCGLQSDESHPCPGKTPRVVLSNPSLFSLSLLCLLPCFCGCFLRWVLGFTGLQTPLFFFFYPCGILSLAIPSQVCVLLSARSYRILSLCGWVYKERLFLGGQYLL